MMTSSTGSLECGIDEINSLGSRNYARFHFSGPQSISGEFPSASGQNESRITSIGIYYDEQSGLSMDGLDILLSDFQFLKHLDLNFVRPTPNYSVQMVVDQLPNVVKTNIQVRINGSSCSMRISEKPLAPSGRSIGTTCCGHIKNKIGTYFLLNTVFYDFDISLKLVAEPCSCDPLNDFLTIFAQSDFRKKPFEPGSRWLMLSRNSREWIH